MSEEYTNEEVMDFTIEMDDEEHRNRFRQDVSIDRTDLDGEFHTHHVKYAYYAMLHEMAKNYELRCKKVLEDTYAILDHEKRQGAESAGLKKYTEKMCDSEVRLDVRYQTALNSHLKAKRQSGMLGAQREAMSQRKDMLMQIGASSRVGVGELRSADLEEAKKRYLGNKGKE